ncbi:MAG: threonine ammonia-lyase [Chloroflexota bacterium]
MDIADIQAAATRIADLVQRTPLLPSRYWSEVVGGRVWLKAECLQRTGSFKLRGAANMVRMLSPEERARGVIAASAGNHAQGVAVAAQAEGIRAVVVMPAGASFAKVEAARGYGAEVVLEGASYAEAAQAMYRLAAEQGLTVIPAFDDERVIAGQGTVGLEIVEQCPDVDIVLVPVGGGGLAAGVALAVKTLRPTARVVGVQAAAAPAAWESFIRRHPRTVRPQATIADGIAVSRPGDVTLPLLLRYVDDMVTVDDESIAGAMVALLERSKLVAEGAGAVGAAALLAGAVNARGCTTVLVVSGGNIDMNLLGRVVEHGLAHAGRYLVVRVALHDRPGQLARVLRVLAEAGANVLDIYHRRTGSHLTFGQVQVELLLETRNAAHAEAVCAALEAHGYHESPALESASVTRVFVAE